MVIEVEQSVKVTFSWRVYSLNQLLRMHWAKRNKIAQDDKRKGAELAKVLPFDLAQNKVKITRMGKRAYDYDNFVGGCKGLVDGLAKGWGIDDKNLVVEYHQLVGAMDLKLMIEVVPK